MKMILSPFYYATSGAVQSPIKSVRSRNLIEEIPVVPRVGLWFGHHFALRNYYACSTAIGVVSLSQGSLLQSVPSLQVSVAIPYNSIVMVSIGSSSGS